MQRSLLAAVSVTVTEEGEDVLENGPCQTVEELQSLSTELGTKEKRTKLVVIHTIHAHLKSNTDR